MLELMDIESDFQHNTLPKYDVLQWKDSMMIEYGGDFNHFYFNVIAAQIEKYYFNYDGFIIIHNIDSLAYTASYLSFIFENLQKPVVLTSCAVASNQAFSDAKQNLLSSMIIAGMINNSRNNNDENDYKYSRNNNGSRRVSRRKQSGQFESDGSATFAEVVVCLNRKLFRGNRVTRHDVKSTDGFVSLSTRIYCMLHA